MRKIVRSRKLDAELTEIFESVALNSLNAAIRFLEAADKCFQQLATFPDLGVSNEFSPAPLQGLRRWRIKEFPNYLVFYRSEAEQIEILHVVHGARDLNSLFDE